MITYHTLENITSIQLLETFNLAFSDYIVPFSLTKEQLEFKIKSEGIRLEFSVGAFEEGRLIAFILHGYDVLDNLKVAYNGGTGVIPSKRGNHLTANLYAFILPVLTKHSIDKVLLEVIINNQPAIKTYTNIGFEIIRMLNCVKGSFEAEPHNDQYKILELNHYDWPLLTSFWDFEPTWQNAITAVEKIKQSLVSIGIYNQKDLLGYVIFNPKSGKIVQLAVSKEHRRKGIGQQLLGYLATHYGKSMVAINVDDSSTDTAKFLRQSGLQPYIQQYEMELLLK